MKEINEQNRKLDEAWDRLHARLERDGLLNSAVMPPRHHTAWIVSAAAVACIIIASVFTVRTHNNNRPEMTALLNGADQTTLVTTLEDSSIVYLAENSTLYIPEHFEEDRRDVRLQGNAAFDIAGNAARPFYIQSGEIQIKVLGTAFQINHDTAHPFVISVKRGLVELTNRTNGRHIEVKAGETVTALDNRFKYSDAASLYVDIASNEIRFKDESLYNILRVINKRYPNGSIEASPELYPRMLTLSLSNETPEELSQLLSIVLKTSCSNEGSQRWYIHGNK